MGKRARRMPDAIREGLVKREEFFVVITWRCQVRNGGMGKARFGLYKRDYTRVGCVNVKPESNIRHRDGSGIAGPISMPDV